MRPTWEDLAAGTTLAVEDAGEELVGRESCAPLGMAAEPEAEADADAGEPMVF
jgi:hypothetical protein